MERLWFSSATAFSPPILYAGDTRSGLMPFAIDKSWRLVSN